MTSLPFSSILATMQIYNICEINVFHAVFSRKKPLCRYKCTDKLDRLSGDSTFVASILISLLDLVARHTLRNELIG